MRRLPMKKKWQPGMMQVRLFVKAESGAIFELAIPDAAHAEKRLVLMLLGVSQENVEAVIAEAEAKHPRKPE